MKASELRAIAMDCSAPIDDEDVRHMGRAILVLLLVLEAAERLRDREYRGVQMELSHVIAAARKVVEE